jgi:Cu(I)/Ag(I) efflux system membrane protein CusA/SilA
VKTEVIERVIQGSLANRPLVLLLTLILVGAGIYVIPQVPLDALPDLSDVQVIIKTPYPGQAPQVVEDQVTYPLASALLAVPGATAVRGYSFFGDSYLYIIFEDGTDPYWARSRVLEYLSQVTGQLPDGVRPTLGPDASGVGWVYQYALVDRSGRHSLAELRSLQDWFLKYELQTVPGVAEVATLGGMVKQYQVVLDPGRLRINEISPPHIKRMIQEGNQEVSGSVIEMGEAEYLIRSRGYITNLEDLRRIPYVKRREAGAALLLDDIAEVRLGPQMRRGMADLNGEGEVVGGIVVMRWGANALKTIEGVKAKLAQLRTGLPAGVEMIETYDRSSLIKGAVTTLKHRLVEEFVLVALVCAVFLLHLRSALVIVLSLPVGIVAAFILMYLQGIDANIMSLGGIAIAIGAMVDATIVMVENVHKHLEREALEGQQRLRAIRHALFEVGPPLFFSLMIITVSFLPVLALQAQEGRLFRPLAFTKTYAMAAAAGVAITLVPALIAYLVRGRIRAEHRNPLNRALIAAYRPFILAALQRPGVSLTAALLLVATALWPLYKLGTEFMPPLDEGALLYMPTTLPGISSGKALELLQQTDRLIKTVAEVDTVFGKIGRADTATDPAPLMMMETTIQLKPREEWRPGMTLERLKQELDTLVDLPGLSNAWLMPIHARIDMLATGIKTPVGVKVAGDDLAGIQALGSQIERVLMGVPGTASVYAERVSGARYIDIEVDRDTAAHYGLSISDIQEVIGMAVGGMNLAYTVEGRERYPIQVRYPHWVRSSVERLRELPLFVPGGEQIRLGDVAQIAIQDGPDLIKSENARLNVWVYVDIKHRDLGSYVAEAQRVVAERVKLAPGDSLTWSGQYEYLVRAKERLQYIIPLTLGLILVLLYLNFRNLAESLMVMGTVPLALVGGFWLLYGLGYHLSVAVGVGFIALAGVAAEFGVVMLVYLDQAVKQHRPATRDALREAVIEGALLRVRPKAMTAAVVIAGLLPIMLGAGVGSEVMKRIATPLVGGMVTAPLVSMGVIPVLYFLWKRKGLPR